ncbi:MAG: hypothetical protein GX174_12750 [Lentisphaerae bacterium]|jgi:hypothetical protein|nr:hypothetical protein [Lentisphaerota bacterium]
MNPMTTTTQNEFEYQVLACFRKHANTLRLCEPTFRREGYVITATMSAGTSGKVELRYGPAEYVTEIFIYTSADNKRWSLTDLLNNEQIRTWILKNKPDMSGRSRLETEITFAFSLLNEGLVDIPDFHWLASKA